MTNTWYKVQLATFVLNSAFNTIVFVLTVGKTFSMVLEAMRMRLSNSIATILLRDGMFVLLMNPS